MAKLGDSSVPPASTPKEPPVPVAPGAPAPAELLECLTDAVYFVDRHRRISYWNHAAEVLTGFSREEVVGVRCNANVLQHVDENGRPLCKEGCPLLHAMRSGHRGDFEMYLHRKDGARIPVHVRANTVVDRDGRTTGVVEVFSDNSARQAYKTRVAELERLAMIDPLTGLPNRRYFDDRLEAHEGELTRYGWGFGLLFVDIDFFKKVNDTFGHEVGDRLLKVVAATLAANCRSADVVTRWGGEEFAILAPNADAGGLRTMAEKLRSVVAASGLRTPHPIQVTVSIGGAIARPGETPACLLKRADECLYEAKRSGRDRVVIG